MSSRVRGGPLSLPLCKHLYEAFRDKCVWTEKGEGWKCSTTTTALKGAALNLEGERRRRGEREEKCSLHSTPLGRYKSVEGRNTGKRVGKKLHRVV